MYAGNKVPFEPLLEETEAEYYRTESEHCQAIREALVFAGQVREERLKTVDLHVPKCVGVQVVT